MCLAAGSAAMAAEAELQEAAAADVLWPGHHHHHRPDYGGRDEQRQQPHCWPSRKQPRPRPRPRPRLDDDDDGDAAPGGGSKVCRPAGSSSSAPVAIVVPVTAATRMLDDYDDAGSDDVPPHVALEARRRWSEGRAAASMCEGRGRTLKGHDLQNVRTAVLRMTGFIET